MRHLRDAVDADLREISLDEADVAPAVLLLLVAVPVGDLRADLCRCLWQSVVVPRPENVMDSLVRVGLQVCLDGVVFLFRIVTRQREALRWEGRFQHLAVPRCELERQNVARKQQLSDKIRQLVRCDAAVDDRAPDRQLAERQKPRQARAAERAAVGRIEAGDAVRAKIVCDLIDRLLD